MAKKRTRIVSVTPARARKMLAKIKAARVLSSRRIARYAEAMARGAWVHDALPPIAFDTDGALVDGHHRLRAVDRSGATVRMLVVEGVDPDPGDKIVH